MGDEKIMEVGNLIWRRGMDFLRQKVGDSIDDSSLLHIAKDVVKECKGLPLAIVTVTGGLKRKSKSSWKDALVQLQRTTSLNQVPLFALFLVRKRY
ncbi:hypothetical protein KY285_000360 [Solanum tuberosum]|nr:hypothetical protein KY285_000360 [Solanum tuberosum]